MSPSVYGYPMKVDERAKDTTRSAETTPLSTNGRLVRMGAIVLMLVALTMGTFWGDDDHFPFGPFRMYSVANKTDGEIRATALEGTTQSGKEVDINFADIGLRRAEVEGQVDRFLAHPPLLRYLVVAYEEFKGREDALTELRLIEHVNYLRDGRTYRTDEEVVARWSRS